MVWQKDFKEDFAAEVPIWGHSAAPLVSGDLLICVVGGPDALVVAFDKQTGEAKWKSLNASEPGYCAPSIIQTGAGPQLLVWAPTTLHALRPATGEPVWSIPAEPNYAMAIARPQQLGDKLYLSAYGGVSVLLQLKPDGSDVEPMWSGGTSDSLQSSNATPIFTPDAIYGSDCMSGELVAINPTDGSRLWATNKPVTGEGRPAHGTAFLVRHTPSGVFYLFSEKGDLITAELTPQAYNETGRMHVLEPTSTGMGRPVVWSCPAFAERAVFARNDKELVRLDLAE